MGIRVLAVKCEDLRNSGFEDLYKSQVQESRRIPAILKAFKILKSIYPEIVKFKASPRV
jgi:hypothetical protein